MHVSRQQASVPRLQPIGGNANAHLYFAAHKRVLLSLVVSYNSTHADLSVKGLTRPLLQLAPGEGTAGSIRFAKV